MTRRAEVIALGIARLAAAGVPQPEKDARLLFRWASGMSGPQLAASLSDPATGREIGRFERAIEQREGRVPISQITGERVFWGRAFRVTSEVLDPRPETETLVAAALEQPAARVLDLGTGTGCILLTLLAEWPEARGLGTDLGAGALAVARGNASALGLADRAAFALADWLEGVEGTFDLVVSNPPYIPEAEIATLAPEVRRHEPRMALTPGGDGLAAYAAIAAGVEAVMAPGARLLLEVGPGQAAAVGALLSAAGLVVGAPRTDLDGRERVVQAAKSR